ncbi:MAG: helix-turn-helix domain-containing protein [Limnohabitans sp.]
MKTRQFIFDSLRSHLKARHLTYRHIAEKLGVSEQTVKRLFLQQDCSIERLEAICELLQLDLRDLVKSSPRPRQFLQQLSLKQEELLAQHPRLLMVAVCAMSLWTFQDMVQHLNIPQAETEDLLRQLDKMGFLDLMPGNRYRLHVAREFSWIVGGPIMLMVRKMADDYFNHLFEGEGEIIKMINVRVSRHSAMRLRARLEQIAQEYADQVAIDANQPLHERPPLSICIAARRWMPESLQALTSAQS